MRRGVDELLFGTIAGGTSVEVTVYSAYLEIWHHAKCVDRMASYPVIRGLSSKYFHGATCDQSSVPIVCQLVRKRLNSPMPTRRTPTCKRMIQRSL